MRQAHHSTFPRETLVQAQQGPNSRTINEIDLVEIHLNARHISGPDGVHLFLEIPGRRCVQAIHAELNS